MQLSKLQTEILNAPYNKIVVLSSAASGKSRLLTEKVRQVIKSGVDPKQIAVITFTNMAAGELKLRLADDYKDGLYIGTIHGLANYMLCRAGVDTSKILNDEDFDKLFKLIQENPQSVRHLEWILLDEAQDSDLDQFTFMFKMINPDNFFICGDIKQSIYQWRGSRPGLIIELGKQPDVKVFDMNQNYRNKNNILAFAKRQIKQAGLIDNSVAMSEGNGSVTECEYSPQYILSRIQNEGTYGDWAILTRTNTEVSKMIKLLKDNNIPYDTFKQGDLKKQELIEKMKANTVKILTIHSAKGLEWPNVIVMGMQYYNSEEINVNYVAATRAKDNLIWIISKRRSYGKRF